MNIVWGSKRRKLLTITLTSVAVTIAAVTGAAEIVWNVGDHGSVQLPQDAAFDFTTGSVSVDLSQADFSVHNDDWRGNASTLTPMNGAEIAPGAQIGVDKIGHSGCERAEFSQTPLQLGATNSICVHTRDGKTAELSIMGTTWQGAGVDLASRTNDTLVWLLAYTIWN